MLLLWKDEDSRQLKRPDDFQVLSVLELRWWLSLKTMVMVQVNKQTAFRFLKI